MTDSSLCVALTGGTGFVGRHVLPQLLAAGHRVRLLLRDPGRVPLADPAVTPILGDLFDRSSLRTLVQGADAVVHLPGIIVERPNRGQTFQRVHVEGVCHLLEAAAGGRVRRWIHMSALGTRPPGAEEISEYHRTKWLGEQAVRQAAAPGGMSFTIIRPSIIHGPDGEFMQLVKGFWCKAFPPFVPYFGAGLLGRGGTGKLQPVWVEDVARCFVRALTSERTTNETYPLGGPDVYCWPDLYETVRRYLPGARNKRIVAVPAWYAKLIAGLPGVPFDRGQVIMSQEDSTCSIAKVQADFGFELAAFEPTLAEYAGRIG